MARHPIRKLLVLTAIGAVVVAVVRALRGDPAPQFGSHPTVTGGPLPTPTAPEDVAPTADAIDPSPEVAPPDDAVLDGETWVEPADGTCPDGYPIKAKLSSKIFHQPGGAAYERTKPDRCYASAEAAEADGLRAAKR